MKITGVTPWLIQSSSSYWGEFLFVEVTTDASITGWGEITTTTKLANRGLRAMLQEIVTDSMIDLLPAPGLGIDIDPEGARKYLSEEDRGFFDRA